MFTIALSGLHVLLDVPRFLLLLLYSFTSFIVLQKAVTISVFELRARLIYER